MKKLDRWDKDNCFVKQYDKLSLYRILRQIGYYNNPEIKGTSKSIAFSFSDNSVKYFILN